MGVVHAVIERHAPGTRVVDLTHRIGPHDVRAGALTLWRAAPWITPGVVLAVVDPGVGTDRRAIAVRATTGDVLVGPDNGLLYPALHLLGGPVEAVQLETRPEVTRAPGLTFAGRDVFAPAAARAVTGASLADLGTPIDPTSIAGQPVPEPVEEPDGRLRTEVLWVDRFGNAQLGVAASAFETAADVVVRFAFSSAGSGSGEERAVQERVVRVVSSYGAIATDEVALVVDSYGYLALAAKQSPAAAALGLAADDPVWLCRQAHGHR